MLFMVMLDVVLCRSRSSISARYFADCRSRHRSSRLQALRKASDLCGAKHVSFRPQFTGIGGVSFRPLWRKACEVHQMASQGVGPAELYVAAELQVAEHADVHEMESMCRKLGMVKEGVPRGRLAALSRKIDMLTVQARQC